MKTNQPFTNLPSNMEKKPLKLQPGQTISTETLESLKRVNTAYSKHGQFPQYLRELAEIFGIDTNSKIKITTESKLFLAGFLEGEASLNVSAKKLRTAKFGVMIDPEFSITQHVNGFSTLYLALEIFKAGRIRHKTNSNATMVLTIDNRRTLEEKVVPFYENYVRPYGSASKIQRLEQLKRLLELFNRNAHSDLTSFKREILPIWDAMRIQKGQVNEAFADLNAVEKYIDDFLLNKYK